MVHTKIKPSQIILIIVSLIAAVAAIVAIFLLFGRQSQPTTDVFSSNDNIEEIDTPKPDFLNLQYVVNNWADSVSGTVGVMIYDLDNDLVAARKNEHQTFPTASLYKLFVAYEQYLRIARKEVKAKDRTYGDYTRTTCLDKILRESYSPCAEYLLKEIGPSEINEIYEAKGFHETNISSLTSTPYDIMQIMKMYYKHPGLNEETYVAIRDALYNQPASDPENICINLCNWRQGLPAGFSKAEVYNKVGWEPSTNNTWELYHDAALVEFKAAVSETGEDRPARHYIVVVMTKKVTPQEIVQFGRNLEKYVFQQDNVKR